MTFEVINGFVDILTSNAASSGVEQIRQKLKKIDNAVIEYFGFTAAFALCEATITAATGGIGAVSGMVVCTSMGAAVSNAVAVGYADSKVDKFLNKVVDFALETSLGQSFLKYIERKHQKAELERWLPYTDCDGGEKNMSNMGDKTGVS